MSICWPSDSGVTFFDDDTPGPQGVEGWWSDNIIPGRRVFWLNGTWWEKNEKLPYKGYKDIYIDADFFPKKAFWNNKLKFHKGFLEYADQAWDMLKDLILEKERPIFLGHSLGAAIAQILALRYGVETEKIDHSCVTCGTPSALANWGTRKVFKQLVPNAVSVRNGKDILFDLHYIGCILNLFPVPAKLININIPFEEKLTEKGFFKRLIQFLIIPFMDHTIDKYDAIFEPIIRNTYLVLWK
jgi:pimeloyl-ACP methyl ester carboxylesterase